MKNKGFTLIEMIVVVTIIIIISGIAASSILKQINNAKDKKYLIEGKIIEVAADSYNAEIFDMRNKITENTKLNTLESKLTKEGKKYLSSWPKKLKVKVGGKEREISSGSYGEYSLKDLLKYVKDKEESY